MIHRHSWFARLILAAAFVLGAASAAGAAALIDPFSRTDSEVRDPEDWNRIKQSLRDVLTEYKEGAVAAWTGPDSMHGGQAKILRLYQHQGMRCAEVEHVYSGTGGARYALPFCQVADGTWKLAF
jgi:hypothetical protein